jgi:hypothetical protein
VSVDIDMKILFCGIVFSVVAGSVLAVDDGCMRTYGVDFSKCGEDYSLRNYKSRSEFKVLRDEDGIAVLGVRTAATNRIDVSWGVETQKFKVSAGDEFVVRLEMSGALPKSTYVKPGAKVVWYDESGRNITVVDTLGNDVKLETPVTFPLYKSGGGASIAFTKSMVPAKAGLACIVVEVDHPDLQPGEDVWIKRVEYFEHTKGSAWRFDDLEPPELKILTQSPCSEANVPLKFKLIDKSGVDYGKFSCRINGRDVTKELTYETDDDTSRVFVYKPRRLWPLPGIVTLDVACGDVLGNEAVEWGFVTFTSDAVKHPVWKVRDDGIVLKDGTAFFPLGIANVHAAEPNNFDLHAAVSRLKSAGLNLMHTYMVRGRKNHSASVHYDELVSACGKYGVMMLSEPSVRHGTLSSRDVLSCANVLFGRTASPMFGWGIGDDTSRLQSPRDLRRHNRLCKAGDPDLLTVSIDAIGTSVQQAPYIPHSDIVIIELYPMRKATPENDELAKVAKALDDCYEAVRLSGMGNRSVMAMPQVFSGFGRWHRYPSYDELRAMTFVSLACKARGVVYYTYCSSKENPSAYSSEDNASMFEKVTREVAELMPSLALRDASVQPHVEIVSGPKTNVLGGASVRCLLKSDGLLIVANTSHEKVLAKVVLPSGAVKLIDLDRNGVSVVKP